MAASGTVSDLLNDPEFSQKKTLFTFSTPTFMQKGKKSYARFSRKIFMDQTTNQLAIN